MPRVGLPVAPAKQRGARSLATLRRSSPASSPTQLLAVAAGAIAFRLLSTLVVAFVSRVSPRAVAEPGETTFGVAPMITQFVARWLGQGVAVTSTALAWVAFAAAMVMLLPLAQLEVEGERADAAVLLAAVFPFAAIFGQSVALALFFAAAVAAFNNVRRQRWIVGGICGGVAAASIPTGVFILPALAWIGFRDRSTRTMPIIAALLLTTTGCAAYLSYAYYVGGPPGGWIVAAREWGLQIAQAPWVPLVRLFTATLPATDMMSGAVAFIALVAVPLVWWRLNGGYAIYMLAMLGLPLMSGRYDSLGRTCALLFPLFVLAATTRSRVVVMLLAVTSAMFYAIALVL